MPCVVWAEKQGATKTVTDKELLNILGEVNQIDPGWEIEEHLIIKKSIFRKPQEIKLYSLYKHIDGIEWQLINFASRDRKNSFFELVSSNHIINYFNGFLSGVRWAQKGKQNQKG